MRRWCRRAGGAREHAGAAAAARGGVLPLLHGVPARAPVGGHGLRAAAVRVPCRAAGASVARGRRHTAPRR
eukprot:944120-Rhodomonas_salina.1